MQIRLRQNHVIDFLFPVVLLLVFAMSALTVVLTAANVYRATTERSALNDASRTSLSYISEKLHQSDNGGTVRIESRDGVDVLVLEKNVGADTYYTWIYAYEGGLKELFFKKGNPADLSAGQTVLPVQDFTMQQLNEGLFCFSCVDAQGQTVSTLVGLRTAGQQGRAL